MKCNASHGKGNLRVLFFCVWGDDGEQGKEQIFSDIGIVYTVMIVLG